METLVVLSLVMQCILMTAALNNKLPVFGPRMCKSLCQRTVGCSSFQYSTMHLSCILQPYPINRLDGSFQNFTIKENVETSAAAARISCPRSSEMFFSHKTILQCSVDRRVSAWEEPGRMQDARLILFYKKFKSGELREVSLNHKTIHTIPFTNKIRIVAMVYASSVRKFFVVQLYDNRLLMLDKINGNKSKDIAEQVSCMTLDDKRLFYIKGVSSPFKILKKMTLTSNKTVFITAINFKALSMDADITQSVLYVHTRSSLHKVTYKGEISEVSVSLGMGPKCLSPKGGILYYSPSATNGIYKFSFANNTKKLLVKFNVTSFITSLSVIGENVYAVTEDCRMLFWGPQGSGQVKVNEEIKYQMCCGCLVVSG